MPKEKFGRIPLIIYLFDSLARITFGRENDNME